MTTLFFMLLDYLEYLDYLVRLVYFTRAPVALYVWPLRMITS